MGWAIPAAVGVQCARPDRRVAVITGDGCMHMHGLEVQTAARYRLPIIYVVLNNAALGNVWLRAHQSGPLPAELTSIPDHDWAGFARALGAQGFTVTDPAQLEETYRQALAANGTVLIDVKTDKNCPTPGLRFHGRRARMVLSPVGDDHDRAAHGSIKAAAGRRRALCRDSGETQGARRGLRRTLYCAPQPPGARAPHRGAGILFEVRGRAAAPGLSVHRALGRAGDRRGLRMA